MELASAHALEAALVGSQGCLARKKGGSSTAAKPSVAVSAIGWLPSHEIRHRTSALN